MGQDGPSRPNVFSEPHFPPRPAIFSINGNITRPISCSSDRKNTRPAPTSSEFFLFLIRSYGKSIAISPLHVTGHPILTGRSVDEIFSLNLSGTW